MYGISFFTVQKIQIKQKRVTIKEKRKVIPIKTILNQIMKRVANQEEVKAVHIKTIHNQITQITIKLMMITKIPKVIHTKNQEASQKGNQRASQKQVKLKQNVSMTD